MEKRRFLSVLVLAATLSSPAVVDADAPAPMTQAHKKKKAHKPAAPKVSLTCKSDDDCAFTAYEDGACCPMLCQPRAVAKKSAEAIEKYAAACKKADAGCAVPDCAPPRIRTTPACISGRCVARAAPGPTRE